MPACPPGVQSLPTQLVVKWYCVCVWGGGGWGGGSLPAQSCAGRLNTEKGVSSGYSPRRARLPEGGPGGISRGRPGKRTQTPRPRAARGQTERARPSVARGRAGRVRAGRSRGGRSGCWARPGPGIWAEQRVPAERTAAGRAGLGVPRLGRGPGEHSRPGEAEGLYEPRSRVLSSPPEASSPQPPAP